MTIQLEHEVKFRLPSWDDGIRRIEAAGGTNTRPRHFESNQLFDYSDSRIGKRDSALRLRFVGDQAWLTYKGPNHGSGKIKQRRESETFLGDGRAMEAILESLGFEVRFRYEKYRASFRLREAELSCDETPIGAFLEIEGSPEEIAETAERLSLDMKEAMSLSYPRLYQLYRAENPGAPEFMVFARETAASP
ncbi:MAG: class IV adenylate cyclase [Vicinamibacteria bacterium]